MSDLINLKGMNANLERLLVKGGIRESIFDIKILHEYDESLRRIRRIIEIKKLNDDSFCDEVRKKIKILAEVDNVTILKLADDNLINENCRDILLNDKIVSKKKFLKLFNAKEEEETKLVSAVIGKSDQCSVVSDLPSCYLPLLNYLFLYDENTKLVNLVVKPDVDISNPPFPKIEILSFLREILMNIVKYGNVITPCDDITSFDAVITSCAGITPCVDIISHPIKDLYLMLCIEYKPMNLSDLVKILGDTKIKVDKYKYFRQIFNLHSIANLCCHSGKRDILQRLKSIIDIDIDKYKIFYFHQIQIPKIILVDSVDTLIEWISSLSCETVEDLVLLKNIKAYCERDIDNIQKTNDNHFDTYTREKHFQSCKGSILKILNEKIKETEIKIVDVYINFFKDDIVKFLLSAICLESTNKTIEQKYSSEYRDLRPFVCPLPCAQHEPQFMDPSDCQIFPQLDEYGNFIPGSTLKDIGIKDQQRALNILKRCFTTESSPILPETKFEDYRPKEGFDPENIGDLKMILMIFHKIIINMIALDIDTNHIFNIYGIICLYHGYYKQPPCNNDDSCCSSGGGV